MLTGNTLRLTRLDHGLVELCFDRHGESVNKFDRAALDELREATRRLRADGSLRGVLVTSAKEAFIVGADINEFTQLFALDEAELAAVDLANSRLFAEFEDLPVPIACAVNGFALGGGLELALACDYRVMSTVAQVGLPEVTLGICPGFGGTVRLPRLAGMAVALEWVVSGTPRKAEAALSAGVVEAIATPEQLRATALEWLARAADDEAGWRTRRVRHRGPACLDAAALERFRVEAERTARHYPAAAAVVDLIGSAAPCARDEALALEAATFARLAKTATAATLVGIFLDDQAIKRRTRELAGQARPLKQAAVLGAGIMGGGIAYASAVRGLPVIMKDIAQTQLDLGMREADKLLAKQVAGGRMRQDRADAVRASIRPSLDHAGFDGVDIVTEAVVENLDIKKKVLAEVEKQLPAHAVIATNTSSLSVAELASVLERPQNFVGMHYFNPVPVMPLVEVIRGPLTSDATVATAVGLASMMGKTPIVVRDCPGFLVNRIFTGAVLGFVRLIRDGADFRRIDQIMEAFGWPMGPAYLQDVIGMDTSRHVFDAIRAGYPGRMDLAFTHAIEWMVRHGRHGQKNGIGFYRYETDPKGRPKRLPAEATHDLLRALQPDGPRDFTEDEIVDRLMLPMIVEAVLCLEEGIAASAGEIDSSLLLGLGFPRHLGGILRYTDRLGMTAVVERCQRYEKLGLWYAPTERMRTMARHGARFHH